MSHFMTWDQELDAVGLLCPLPVLKARKRLQSMKAGEVLRLIASDPAAVVDVPFYCQESGHILVETEDLGETQIYYLRHKD